ncbi:hypothetical protein FGG08_005975 [Glutinoglossum americanum]|uniref:AB hydrolase-1 domain-containing protein n=1 Tax=Glutinoglossum americanum TaxID=1670608 RepID=A0A9P8I2H5_9PEZI|nr:hypothetical protein FGG08_005975 [Glutinoglossum americanum]
MSASSNKPTIVLIHGAWHTPESFADLCSQLSAYKIITPSLPSSSTTPALPSFDRDVEIACTAIRNVVENEGEDCLVVMHSYGGVVGTEAVKGLKHRGKDGFGGGVVGLVYLASFMLREGESVAENGAAAAAPSESPKPGTNECWLTIENGLGTVHDGPSRFYNDLSPETAAYWTSKLTAQSIASPLTYAAWRYIPTSYLLCTEDHALPFPVQEKLVERAEGFVDVVEEVKSSHSPFLSQIDVVGRFIRKAAGEKVIAP